MKYQKLKRLMAVILIVVFVLGNRFYINYSQAEQEKKRVSTGEVSNSKVIPGGMPIGIYMKANGVLVLGTDYVKGKDGQQYNYANDVVKSGDYIIEINGKKIGSKTDLIKCVKKIDSEDVVIKVRRNGQEMELNLKATMTVENEYKLGIWVRDSVQGLGTVTYITEDNKFGALGHGIHDVDTDELLEVSKGRIYYTQITNIQKGEKGSPGGMEGMIIYNEYNVLGSIDKNTDTGVYGTINQVKVLSDGQEAIPVCSKRNVKIGPAVLRCMVEDEVKEYNIEIVKVNYFALAENKAFVIKVVDEELIDITGGIVQGMSGSPIIQDGKLVGAVTHVLVNDPTRGYGIFIENMLEAAG